MKKIILILLLCIAFRGSVFAQAFDSVRLELDNIFRNIDKSKIPSGYLDEYGPQFMDKFLLKGVLADSNFIPNRSTFNFLYNDIENAKIYSNAISLPTLETVNGLVTNDTNKSATPLIILNAQYSTLREDAIQQNLFTYSNNQVFDVPGRTQSPYLLQQFFAACPLSEIAAKTNSISLKYSPGFTYTNCNKVISNIAIDFLDGQGYRVLPLNGIITKTYADSSGYKKFLVRVQCTDGSTSYCYSQQYVKVVAAGGNERYIILTEPELVNPAYTIPGVTGQYNGAKIYIRYSSKRTGTSLAGKLVKLLIIVEGYDIHDIAPSLAATNYDVNKLIREWDNLKRLSADFDFNKELDEVAGYDLVFIDYYTMDKIQNNSKMLQAAINLVNATKVNNAKGTKEQNVVIGISMGGVLARYTLARMTKQLGTASTQTRALVTHDSPHQGANIPLGLQHFLYDFGEARVIRKIKDISVELQQFDLMNQQPATEQLLIARVTGPQGMIAYNNFLSGEYRSMITFTASDPQPSYQFKAVSQGSQCAKWTMQPGTTLSYRDGNMATVNLLGFFFANRYKLTIQVNALPAYGSSSQISYVKMQRNIRLFYGLIGTGWKTTYESRRLSPANIFPWDCVPGGTQSASGRSGHSFSSNGSTPDPTSMDHSFFGNLWRAFVFTFFNVNTYLEVPFQQDIFTHVPLVSALDVQNVSAASFNQPFIFSTGLNGSTADAYIAQEGFNGGNNSILYNINHTDFTKRNSNWIYNEIENKPNTQLNCTLECFSINPQVTGPSSFCANSATYSVSNLPVNSSVSWSVSSAQGIVSYIINGNTITLTKTGNGIITLTATVSGCNNETSTFSSQPIVVGIPQPASIIASNIDPAIGRIQAEATPVPNASSYNWYKDGVLQNSYHGTFAQIPITKNKCNVYYSISVEAVNNCGVSAKTNKNVYVPPCSNMFTVSPNPASTMVTVSSNDDNTSAAARSVENEAGVFCDAVRIYDLRGNLVLTKLFKRMKKAGVVITGIKPGTYFIEITSSTYKEKQLLMIQ